MMSRDIVLPGEIQPSGMERSQVTQVGELLAKAPASTADVSLSYSKAKTQESSRWRNKIGQDRRFDL